MFYYLYEVRNTVNNKIYVGVHKTLDLDDGYMGSGKILSVAKKKYGIDNFSKRILEMFDCEEEMFNRESEIVNAEFIRRDDTYNIKIGGFGGWDFVNSDEKIRNDRRERTKGSGNSFFGKTHSEETKLKLSRMASVQWSGVGKSDEHRQKIAEALRGIPFTDERKKNISDSKKGKAAWNKGKEFQRIQCPHCGTIGGGSNMKRWHFDNCKHKVNSE